MTKKIQDLAKNKQDNTFKKEKNFTNKKENPNKNPDTPLFVKGFHQLFNFCHNN